MSHRHDPNEHWRWEEQRQRETHEIEQGGRPARDAGDPRWGTGGMLVDEHAQRASRELAGREGGGFRRESIPARVPMPWQVGWDIEAPAASHALGPLPHGATPGPYVGRGPRGYRRSDEWIREELCERFTLSGELDPSDVEVGVRGGEVTLSGTVGTRAQKRLAEDIADAVFGVVEVHNHLRVHRPGVEPPAYAPGAGER